MPAGALRFRATFQRETRTTNASGGATSSWGTYHECWAGFVPERGVEVLQDGHLQASVAGTLTIRSSTETRGIAEDDRVVVDGNTYQIRRIINPDQRDRYLEMVVERGVGQ